MYASGWALDWTNAITGTTIDVPLDRSGEVLIRLAPQDPPAPTNEYRLAVQCAAGCDEASRFPGWQYEGDDGTQPRSDRPPSGVRVVTAKILICQSAGTSRSTQATST